MLLRYVIEESTNENIIEQLKKDCSKSYAAALKDKLLIRGLSAIFSIQKIQVNQNRKPVDTPKDIDYLIEQWRKNHFPNIPSRRKSLFAFATSRNKVEASDANNYGSLYVVFVPNDTKYFQSKNVADFTTSLLYEDLRDMILVFKANGENDIKKLTENYILEYEEKSGVEIKKELDYYFKDSNSSLNSIQKRDYEVVMQCKYYYAVRFEDIQTGNINLF